MIKVLWIATALALPLANPAAYGQQASAPARGGTLPLDDLEASDGTLPLRLPSDGTLPLRLAGDAVDQSAGARVATHVTLTQAERRAMPAPQRPSLVCQLNNQNVSKHTAKGTIVVSGASYQVKGICYDHSSKNMEIVGVKGSAEKSFMIGNLPNPDLTSFSGSLIVDGQTTKRYQFAVRSQGE